MAVERKELFKSNFMEDLRNRDFVVGGRVASVQERESSGFFQELIKPVQATGRNIAELFPEVREVRRKIQELREYGDTEFADKLEEKIGKEPTLGKVIGDAAQTALLAVPIPGARLVRFSPLVKNILIGGGYGGGFSAARAMSDEKQAGEVLIEGLKGAAIGAPLMVGGSLVFKYGGIAVSRVSKAIGVKVPEMLKPTLTQLRNEKIFGKTGKLIADGIENASDMARRRTGEIIFRLSQVGLAKVPRLFPWQKKVPVLSTDNAWRAENSLFDMLEGRATQKLAQQETKAAYSVANKFRREVAEEMAESPTFQKKANFFPHQVPEPKTVALSSAEKEALRNAKTPAERVAIHLQSGKKESLRRDVLENAVFKQKKFSSVEKAAKTLDGWIDWRSAGGTLKDRRIDDMVSYLLATKQARTRSQAVNMLQRRFVEANPLPLSKSRELDFPFYDPDPRRVLPTYALDSILKVERMKQFGFEGSGIKGVDKLVEKIQRDEGFDAFAKATELVDVILGRMAHSKPEGAITLMLRTLQTPLLSFAQILNMGQSSSTWMRTDFPSLLSGIGMAFRDEGIRNALRSGATLQSIMNQQAKYVGGFGASQMFKYSGFTWTEMFNRTVASNTGREYVRRVHERFLKNPSDKNLRLMLEEMGVSTERLVGKKEVVSITLDKGIVPGARFSIAENRAIPGKLKEAYAEKPPKLLTSFKSVKEILEADPTLVPSRGAEVADRVAKNLLRDDVTLFRGGEKLEVGSFLSPFEDVAKRFGPVSKLTLKRGELALDSVTGHIVYAPKGVHTKLVKTPLKLTEKDLDRAGDIISKDTQFLYDPGQMPAFASSPWGKVFTQYKSFGYFQARFLKRMLVDKNVPMTRKARNLLILGIVFPMTGEVIADVRSMITGRQRPTGAFDRYMDNIYHSSASMIVVDLWRSAAFNGATEFFVGPTFSRAGALADSHIRGLGRADPEPAIKFWLEQSGVGRIISTRVWQQKVKGRGSTFQFWEDL